MTETLRFRSCRGFTLIEMMVVVTIAAIMLAIGVPSFKSFTAGQRVKTAASDFATAATLARSEAIKRNAEVDVVAAATGWQDGWSITAGTVTIGTQSAYTGLVMTMVTPTPVAYLGNGRLDPARPQPILQVSGSDGGAVRCVSFDLSGLPKTRLGNC